MSKYQGVDTAPLMISCLVNIPYLIQDIDGINNFQVSSRNGWADSEQFRVLARHDVINDRQFPVPIGPTCNRVKCRLGPVQ